MEETTEKKLIAIPGIVRVGELAERLSLPVTGVIAELMKNGVLATINESIDFDTAAIIADSLGFTLEQETAAGAKAVKSKSYKLEPRPPVVTVMGHVDHGKTSLLDAIRETKVTEEESGGITQHIGAYQVESEGKPVTFLDTPGHEAFSAMRAHGANVTDVVVLVVAADDGVKPQTTEAVTLAKAAGVPIIVAINKIDKAGANPEKVKQELAALELIPEDWGGKTVMVPVSAKNKEGLEKLLEMILLVSDVKALEASPGAPASGVVIESKLDPGKGPVATILIQNGTLAEGATVQVGGTYGRIKTMEDYRGKKLKAAGPSVPVRISGLKEIPQIADFIQVFTDEKAAREEATKVLRGRSAKRLYSVKKIGLDELTAAVKEGEVKELNVILKADVQGSLDALVESISKIRNEEVAAKIVHKGVGEITESDVKLGKSTGAVIFGFRVRIPSGTKELAQKEGVTYSIYDVIYELLDDIRSGLSSLMSPIREEIDAAKMKILKVFKTGKTDSIVGGKISTGKVSKGLYAQVVRGSEVVAAGTVDSVRREKDEVPEMAAGSEAGVRLMLDMPKQVKEGDSIRFYRVEEKQRSL